MMNVSFIVVNYNTCELLRRCLASIQRYTADLMYEIIVVDNASTDGSQAMIRGRYPKVRLLEQSRNQGFAYANNRGVEIAQGQAIFLLNSDTELVHNAPKILYDYLFGAESMGACGGLLVYQGGSPQWSYGYYPSLGRLAWITFSGLLHIKWGRKPGAVIPEDLHTPRPVEYIVGADLMVKREVLDKVGLLDEHFFAYCEETDLCRRIRMAGYEVWFNPDARIVHRVEGSFKSGPEERWRIYYTSLFHFLDKYAGCPVLVKIYLLTKFWLRSWGCWRSAERNDARVRLLALRRAGGHVARSK